MTDSDEKPDNIFDEVIEGASGVCQNCYQRTHEVDTDWWPHTRAWEPIVKSALTDERWFGVKQHTERVPNAFRPAGSFPAMKRACECGMMDTYSRQRPLSKANTIRYTHHIVERLEERDIPFDEDILFDKVREMKEDGDNQYSDEDIYREAVDAACDIGVVQYRRRKQQDDETPKATA